MLRPFLLALPLVGLLGLAFGATSYAQSAEPPNCITSGSGERACGYSCLSSYGIARCAQTAQGICTQGSDTLACWDPPGLVRQVVEARTKAGKGNVPKPSCLTSAGKTACGYHCLTGFDQVQCAETPWGTCAAGDGAIACWDPPAAVLASFARAGSIPSPSCSTTYGQIVCGYRCAATAGKVACSQTPEGICRQDQGQATCFDPPVESSGVVYNPGAAVSCMEGAHPRACGHHCVAMRDQLACSPSERGVCTESHGNITCRP